MSEHWKPDTDVVPLRPGKARREWNRLHAYWQDEVRSRPLPDGGKAGLVLVAAACFGAAIGIYQVFGPREVIAPGALATAVETIVADVQPTAGDVPRASGAPEDGALVHFTHCHSGGGSDCVVDGDTFYLAGAKVRIAGIDAPETHPPRCASEARLGIQATETLRALLNSGAVTMTGIGRDRDTYGRLLRNVAVDGRDVGQAMIGAGVAREYAGRRQGWC